VKRDYTDTDYLHEPPEPGICPKCKEKDEDGYMIRQYWWSNWFICDTCGYGESVDEKINLWEDNDYYTS